MKCNPLRWILLGLLLVPVMTYFAVQHRHGHIQDDLRERSITALEGAGLPWAGSVYDGRNGLLTGTANMEAQRDRAYDVVNKVWGVYQTDNDTNLSDRLEHYSWSAKLRKKRLFLGGYVPDDATRQTILAIAKTKFPGTKISDQMRIARGVPPRKTWLSGISYALTQLSLLRRGGAKFTDLNLSLSGQARNFIAYDTIKSALATQLPGGVRLQHDGISAPMVSPYSWGATLRGNKLELTGHVPTRAARVQINAVARARFRSGSRPQARTVVDLMHIAQGQPNDWGQAVNLALRQLAQLNSGRVTITDTKVSFSGLAQTEPTARKVGDAIRDGLPAGYRSSRKISFIKPAVKTVSPFETRALVDRDKLVLIGYVPSEADRTAVLSAARKRFKNRRIVDKLEIARGAHKGWRKCTIVGIGALARLGNGSLAVLDRNLSVAGTTQNEDLANALSGDVRAATARACSSDVRVDYKPLPEPNLVWTARWSGDNLVLDGEVPDAETKTELVRNASSMYPDADVIDHMTVVGGRSKKWRKVALSGLQMLAGLRKGKVQLDAQQLTVSGEAPDTSTKSAINARISRGLPGGYGGRDVIEVRSDAMIWAQEEAKRKKALEAKLAVERQAARLAATELKRRNALDEKRRAEEEKLRFAALAARRESDQREAARLAALGAKRRAEELARKQEAERVEADRVAALIAAEQAAAMARERVAREKERAAMAAETRRQAEQKWRMAALETERRQAAELRRLEQLTAERKRASQRALAAKQAAQDRLAELEAARRESMRAACQDNMSTIAKSGLIRFRTAKANLSNASFPTLNELADAAKQCPGSVIEIAGHTDSDGSLSNNQSLSERRAKAVRDFLIKAGVKKNRLRAVGYGEVKPIAPNDSRSNKALNRRIEFTVRAN